MPVITKIKPQRNKKRVNIYLDGKFGFGLDLKNYMKLGLKVEQEFSEKETENIIKKAEFQKTLDKILRYATLRPRSENEFKTWLRKYRVHESLHNSLFNRLKSLELLDDEKFAKWWVEQRTTFRPRGKKALSSELMKKRVSRDIIENVLSEVKIDEEKIARGLLDKKKYRWERLGKLQKRKKMSEFLARKGFEWGVIRKVVIESDG